MDIEGLDYNTQREALVLPEYGRAVQKMVDHAKTLPTKEERLQCAESIIAVMAKMSPQGRDSADYRRKLWDHLAIMSHFELDIDYPYDISSARSMAERPQSVGYPQSDIPIRHYGKLILDSIEHLKTMPAGSERDELVRNVANQMRRCLVLWGHGSNDGERVASDLARLTDGAVQLDLSEFKFEPVNIREMTMADKGKKRR